MKLNTAYINNKRVTDDHFFLCTPSLATSEMTPTKKAKTFKLHPRRSAIVIGCALALLLSSSPSADAFANMHASRNNFSTQLSYRSLHHGPDVEPLTEMERLGADFTKMPKDMLDRFADLETLINTPIAPPTTSTEETPRRAWWEMANPGSADSATTYLLILPTPWPPGIHLPMRR